MSQKEEEGEAKLIKFRVALGKKEVYSFRVLYDNGKLYPILREDGSLKLRKERLR